MAKPPLCEKCGKHHRTPTPKQARFAELYLISMNATKAAIGAGYSKHTASQLGYKLVQKSSVQCRIDQEITARSERTHMDQDWVLERLANLIDLDLLDLFDKYGKMRRLDEIPEDTRKLLAGLETFEEFQNLRGSGAELIGYTKKIKVPDKLKAIELVMRNLKMLTDRVEVAGQFDVREEILKGRERVKKRATG